MKTLAIFLIVIIGLNATQFLAKGGSGKGGQTGMDDKVMGSMKSTTGEGDPTHKKGSRSGKPKRKGPSFERCQKAGKKCDSGKEHYCFFVCKACEKFFPKFEALTKKPAGFIKNSCKQVNKDRKKMKVKRKCFSAGTRCIKKGPRSMRACKFACSKRCEPNWSAFEDRS